jgi:DNA invertase Pin-like site-specific DNA recombinase
MASKALVAYYRVSTDRQGKSGLGLDAQERAVREFASHLGVKPISSFTEVESGRKKDRPELANAIAECKRFGGRLVIAKLDRLARKVAFVSNLMESGVDFVACDMPEANRLTIHILAAVAEHEREMISERTRAALATARARGTPLGFSNPRLAYVQQEASEAGVVRIVEDADRFARKIMPAIKGLKACGVTSLRGIARALQAQGIPTQRGGAWTPTTVRNIIHRHSLLANSVET